jgi:hypothetical protein
VLTALVLFIDFAAAVDAALAGLHEWGPPLVAIIAAVIAVAGAADTVRTRVRTARALAALRAAGPPRSTPPTCTDTVRTCSADARPATSGHGSGGDS